MLPELFARLFDNWSRSTSLSAPLFVVTASSVGVVSVGVVQRHHVRGWAERVDARYGLPELVRRLVRETSEGPVEAEFAIDEGVNLGGFDGRVQAEAGSCQVPSGYSVWEVSTERSVGSKADADYDNRDAAPPGWSMPETAYVAVSLRAWRERAEWAEQRTREGRWREVRALGLDDVMSWLADAPMTELWLADRLTLHPEELQLGSRWWNEYRRGTGGLFDRHVALAGRSHAATELRRRIDDDAGPIVVEAAAVEEALEFIAAVGEASDELANDENLLHRMMFVSGQHALQRLLAEEGPEMVLVLTDPELSSAVGPSKHTVVITRWWRCEQTPARCCTAGCGRGPPSAATSTSLARPWRGCGAWRRTRA